MSHQSGGILGDGDATTAWDDETRTAFDKRYVEQIERQMEAFEAALGAVEQAAAELKKLIDSLRD